VRIVADVHARIVAAVRALSSSYDHLFTSGGIGPTHDDITADAVAEAMGARSMFATTRAPSFRRTTTVRGWR
jgi:molybdopterin-biosynthesis enzyme MoeA-like protein